MSGRDILLVSGLQVLDVSDLIDVFNERVFSLVDGEIYSIKIPLNCLFNGRGVVTDIILSGGAGSIDQSISSEIEGMINTLRENGGGVVSRNIDNLFVLGERRMVEFSLEIPHAR